MDLAFSTAIGFPALNMFSGKPSSPYSNAYHHHHHQDSSSCAYFPANYYSTSGYQHGFVNLRPNKSHDYSTL